MPQRAAVAVVTGQLAVVEAWLDAVDRADTGAATALCAPDLEIVGPRGSVRGREVLGPWLARAGFRARPLRWFCGAGGEVVVEQDATWADPATGAERGRAVVAARFLVTDGVIARVQRHDDGLPTALAAAGLRESDEVTARRCPAAAGTGQPCARTCWVTSSATRSGASSGMKWGRPSSTSSR